MKNTIKESIPETLQGLEIFLEAAKKENERINKLSRAAEESYKSKSGKDYEYKNRWK